MTKSLNLTLQLPLIKCSAGFFSKNKILCPNPWPHRNTILIILSMQIAQITRFRNSWKKNVNILVRVALIRLYLTSYFACNDLRAVSWFFERLLFRFFAIFGSELVFFDCLRDEARRSPMLFILSLLLIGWRHFGHFLTSFEQDEQQMRWPQGLNWIVGVDSSQIKQRSGIISLSW